MSNMMLRHLVALIEGGVRTDKGFKEAHLNTVARKVTEQCGVEVSGSQVYNHLRKWRSRWVKICKLRDISGALWDDNTHSIVLEDEHYKGHIKDHPADVDYLNVPLENYEQMVAIFSVGQATGRYAMGSNEPLGPPPDEVESEGKADPISTATNAGIIFPEVIAESVDDDTNTNTPPPHASEEVAVGSAGGKGKDSSSGAGSKRKRAMITEDEAIIFNGMTEAVKDMAGAIKATVHAEAHPDVYNAVMNLPGFSEDALLAALDWLYDHKPQSIGFVQMSAEHRRKWMNRWIAKHYFTD
ncbi:uncharacterized protein LOC133910057 [Phragmites australis]|uniref:uncharacterized protein LOC133910057 n=1 Tax=Phragmites australis TaxID=29695 RepID=UPI002D77AC0E|nr:uncharacterized protein LOC133910057 [Phragmites australis]